MTDFGIDVSHHNEVKDWNAVRGNNITFALVKLTESTDFADPAAAGHADRARAAGIKVGGYHFARTTDNAAQVGKFAARLAARGLLDADSVAPVLDMEDKPLRSRANAFIADFIARLRSETGIRRVIVYANKDWFENTLRPGDWADDDVLLWLARFNGDPGNTGFTHPKLALHQHTDHGSVPGVPGRVDRNVTVGHYSLADLLIGDGARVLVPAQPETHVVQAGETLFGIAARNHTTVAELQRLNSIPDPDVILIGQILRLR